MGFRTEMIGAAPVPSRNIELQQRNAAVKPDPISRPVTNTAAPVAMVHGKEIRQDSCVEDAILNFQVGEQYFLSGEYGKAIQSYKAAEKSAQADLNNADACMVLSSIYDRYGNQNLSIEFAKRALDIENENNMLLRMESFPDHPESREALYLLAGAYLKGGLPQKTLETIPGYSAAENAKQITKDTLPLFVLHAQAVYIAGSDDPANYQKALEEVEAIKRSISGLYGENGFSAEDAGVYSEMISVCYSCGMYDDAIKIGEEISGRFPNLPGVSQALASCYLAKLDYDKAISLLAGQGGIEAVDFSKMDAQGILSLFQACITKIGVGKDPDNKMSLILPKLMERITGILAAGGEYFPENIEMISLRQTAYSQALSYGKSAELSDIIAGNMPAGGENYNSSVRQALNDRIMDSIIANSGFSIDGKSVELEKLESFTSENKNSGALETGTEMRLLTSNKYGNPYFLRDANMGRLKEDLSAKRPDFMSVSCKEAVMLAAELTMEKLHYTDDYLTDLQHIPLEDKIDGGKGVCRHYAPIFKAYFEAIKSENPNLSNTYCINLLGNMHTWDMVLDVRPDKIVALNIDPTFDDSDDVFGNNLDGYDEAHFEPLSDDPEVLQRNMNNNPGAGWMPFAQLKLANITLSRGDYAKAAEISEQVVDGGGSEEIVASACLIGIQATLMLLLQGNPEPEFAQDFNNRLQSLGDEKIRYSAFRQVASFYSQLAASVADNDIAAIFNMRAAELLTKIRPPADK